MATYSALPATLNLVATVGNDFTLSLTVTENGSPWVATGATLATDIIDSSGTVVATDFTTAASTGTVSLSLTDANTTTLGVGVYSYRLSVTKSSLTRDWIAGTLSIVEAGQGGSSTSSASLSISNSAVTLSLTSLVAPLAENISVADTGANFAGTNVETVLAEIDDRITAHIDNSADAHDASAISVLDSGGYYTATDVEAALAEVLALLHPLLIKRSVGKYLQPYGNTTGTVSVAVGSFTMCNMVIPYPGITIDRIAVEVTTAVAGATPRLGIYGSTSEGLPGSLIADFGTVDGSTTGVKELTVSQALPAGRIWLVAAQQGSAACTLRGVTGIDWTVPLTGSLATLFSSSINGYQSLGTSTTGAFPATAPSVQVSGSNAKILVRMA